MNTALMLQLVISLLEQMNAVALTLRTAAVEGRDVSDAEIAAALSADDAAKAKLQAAIDAALAGTDPA